jgi:alkylhydroperoxidase family enzyme
MSTRLGLPPLLQVMKVLCSHTRCCDLCTEQHTHTHSLTSEPCS